MLWNPAQSWVFQNAVDKNLPIVLFFVEKDDEETRKLVNGQKVAEYSTDKAMFVIVPKLEQAASPEKSGPAVTGGGKAAKPEAKTEKVESSTSPVPVSKLSATDLWKAYAVTKANTMIVADWHGNSQTTYTSVPKEGVLTRALDVVPETIRATEAKVDAELVKLNAQLEKGNDGSALKNAMKIFKMDVVGFAGVNTSIEKYNLIIARGRERMKTIEAQGDASAMRKLRSEFKGTDLDAELESAVARLTAATKKE